MIAAYKFIQKFWVLHKKIKQKIEFEKNNNQPFVNEKINEFTNQMLNKINISLNKFSYNVIVANLHEIYSFYNKTTESKNVGNNLQDNYIKILTIMLPIVPHISNECLSEVTDKKILNWPKVENKYLKNKEIIIVIQINGKKRSLIKVKADIEEKNLIELAKDAKEIKKYLEEKIIIKSIFIKNKLINLIVK